MKQRSSNSLIRVLGVLGAATVGAILMRSSVAHAEALSKEALYNRCYAQLTGSIVPKNDPNLPAFKAGTGDPIATCLALLDRAKLTAEGNTTIGDPADVIAKKILSRVQAMHSTFFSQTYFHTPDRTTQESQSMGDMFDPSAPALFLTRALLAPSVNVSSVVTDTANYKPKRTNMNPATGPQSGSPKANFLFDGQAAFALAPTGDLLGVMPTGLVTLTYPFNAETRSMSFGANAGGGVLGSPGYLTTTVGEDVDYQATLLKMPRRWAKSVFHDFLCREFPAIRVADATPFVQPAAQNPFRRSSSCVQCHATMDRTASTLRGFHYEFTARTPTLNTALGPMWYRFTPVTLPAETGWPSAPDVNYPKRPPTGTFYFRNVVSGALVDIPVTSVADLGAKISQQDDFYICLANRYWNYFTEKGVQLDEPSIMAGRPLNERNRFEIIKNLGLSLRTHQSLRQLVEDIMRRSEYGDSAFGTN